MDNKLVLLGRVLQAAREPLEVQSLPGRMRLQKVVYLLQAGAIPLGYRFRLYGQGPHSERLTEDLCALHDENQREPLHSQPELAAAYAQRIRHLSASLFVRPAGAELGKPQWLELLARLHHLLSVQYLDVDEARRLLRQDHGALCVDFDPALARLVQHGLAGAKAAAGAETALASV